MHQAFAWLAIPFSPQSDDSISSWLDSQCSNTSSTCIISLIAKQIHSGCLIWESISFCDMSLVLSYVFAFSYNLYSSLNLVWFMSLHTVSKERMALREDISFLQSCWNRISSSIVAGINDLPCFTAFSYTEIWNCTISSFMISSVKLVNLTCD